MNSKGRELGMPKTGGRQKGTPNKTTAQLRESIQSIVENNIERIQEDLERLKPVDRVKALTELAKFVLPTLKAVGIEAGEGFPTVIIDLGRGEKPEEDEDY